MPLTLDTLPNEILLLISEYFNLRNLTAFLLVNHHLSVLLAHSFYRVICRERFSYPRPKCETALHWASKYGNATIARNLLRGGTDISITSSQGKTALDFAAGRGKKLVVDLLLNSGLAGAINSQDRAGRTPLHSAAFWGHETVVGILLNNGADLTIRTKRKKTPLHLAAERGHAGVVRLLMNADTATCVRIANTMFDNSNRTPLHSAVMSGHRKAVKALLEFGVDTTIVQRGHEYGTALHWAAKRGYTQIVKMLLENGTDVDIRTRDEYTPLHWAVEEGCKMALFTKRNPVQTVKFLLEKGADATATNDWAETPLHIACSDGVYKARNIAWMAGTTIANMNTDEPFPISDEKKARVQGLHISLIDLLLERGVNIEGKELFDSLTPLHNAADAGEAYLPRYLLEKGADVHARNKEGSTALHIAVGSALDGDVWWMDSKAVVRVLVEYGADVTARQTGGSSAMTPLEIAMKEGNQGLADFLRSLEVGVSDRE